MRDIVEILEHWYAGRPIQAVARSLGVDRKTVRKYVALAQSAGYQSGDGEVPPDGWGHWLDQNCPELRERSRRGPAVDEMAALHDEIAKALHEALPTTVWRRLRRAGKLRASLSSFRYSYLRDAVPEVTTKPQITVRRPEPPPGEEAQVDYGLLGMWLNPFTGRRQAINVFALVLSHSRHTFGRAVCRMDQHAWLEGHMAAFQFFGGVPCRLVPDYVARHIIGILCPIGLCAGHERDAPS